jgi:hypothetical protein
MEKVERFILAMAGGMVILLSADAYCPPPYIEAPNQGTLVPYKENGQLVGERCVWADPEDIHDCSCIGMIYYY